MAPGTARRGERGRARFKGVRQHVAQVGERGEHGGRCIDADREDWQGSDGQGDPEKERHARGQPPRRQRSILGSVHPAVDVALDVHVERIGARHDEHGSEHREPRHRETDLHRREPQAAGGRRDDEGRDARLGECHQIARRDARDALRLVDVEDRCRHGVATASRGAPVDDVDRVSGRSDDGD